MIACRRTIAIAFLFLAFVVTAELGMALAPRSGILTCSFEIQLFAEFGYQDFEIKEFKGKEWVKIISLCLDCYINLWEIKVRLGN